MPELAAMYSLGFLAVLVNMGVVVYLQTRVGRSPSFQNLQKNLSQLGYHFIQSEDRIEFDSKSQRPTWGLMKTLMVFGGMCAFLSWFGLFFFLLVSFSVVKIAHKLRNQLLATELATRSMDPDQVTALLRELELLPSPQPGISS